MLNLVISLMIIVGIIIAVFLLKEYHKKIKKLFSNSFGFQLILLIIFGAYKLNSYMYNENRYSAVYGAINIVLGILSLSAIIATIIIGVSIIKKGNKSKINYLGIILAALELIGIVEVLLMSFFTIDLLVAINLIILSIIIIIYLFRSKNIRKDRSIIIAVIAEIVSLVLAIPSYIIHGERYKAQWIISLYPVDTRISYEKSRTLLENICNVGKFIIPTILFIIGLITVFNRNITKKAKIILIILLFVLGFLSFYLLNLSSIPERGYMSREYSDLVYYNEKYISGTDAKMLIGEIISMNQQELEENDKKRYVALQVDNNLEIKPENDDIKAKEMQRARRNVLSDTKYKVESIINETKGYVEKVIITSN